VQAEGGLRTSNLPRSLSLVSCSLLSLKIALLAPVHRLRATIGSDLHAGGKPQKRAEEGTKTVRYTVSVPLLGAGCVYVYRYRW